MPTIGGVLIWSAATTALFSFTASSLWGISITVFFIGMGGALGTVLQTRLMDIARNAQGLAAALNHSAFNFANALGPFLGGMETAHGFGWASHGWVGYFLRQGGLGFILISINGK